MKVRSRRGIVILVMVSALRLSAQNAALNPTVTVLPRATSVVPADCFDARTTQIAEPEPPAPDVAPASSAERGRETPAEIIAPAGDLRSVLRAAQTAAAARDRETFNAALARARAMLSSASAAERNAATGVIAVLEDVARLQEYQLNTPSGSFFDASVQGGSLLKSLVRYPGYEAAMARQTVTDANGVRYYPTRESIDFLLSVATSRMGGAAVRVATEPPASPPTSSKPAAGQTRLSVPQAPPKPKPTKTTARTRRPRTEDRKPAANAAEAPRGPKAGEQRPGRSGTPQAPLIDQEPLVTESIVSTPPETQTTTTDSGPLVTPPTATTDPIAPPASTPTVGTDTEAASAVADSPERRRSIILPLVLILIGVGVLIVLFRASS